MKKPILINTKRADSLLLMYKNLDSYFIKKIDFYRVIEYSLFRRNDDLLPENFHGLPVVDEKNYKNKDAASSNDFKPQELKLAVKFLLKNLLLTPEERRNIRKKEHAIVVMDIKKYLDENGCSPENKEFVKWAFKYLLFQNLSCPYSPGRSQGQPNPGYPMLFALFS
ncbi:hypothetical protein [Pedobacter sp. KBW06]|uniref:hypothetical protein n=1 Tax=Pedobacter sp. KBW06 TaxID=2153359 RepID=UPI00131589C5|nr:hypothetical protein [Pedobacter sp. KBW06]